MTKTDTTIDIEKYFPEMNYKYLGNFSATPPWHDQGMSCHKCKVKWTGCWDNFQCPQCGEGELPDNSIEVSDES